jgi:hypothetical protein
MGYRQAEDLMGEVRRWDANEWDFRDVTAQVYWAARRGPDHDRYVAATRAISQRATAGDDHAKQAEALLKRLEGDADVVARRALERQADQKLEDDYVAKQYPNAKIAVVHAITGEAARSWIPAADAEALTAGFRAAREKLDFQFSVKTRDQQEWDAAQGFVDELMVAYPGTQPTIDPPHKRPVARFSVLGTAYIPGDNAHDKLSHELELFLRKHDPAGRITWPPPDFRNRRPRH